MKVCVPTSGTSGLSEQVCAHFGRAATYTIADLESGAVTVIKNDGTHMGGSRLPPELISEAGVRAILVGGLGPRAVQMFEAMGIEVFVGAGGTVGDALKAWNEGRLSVATVQNACREHKH